VTKRATGRTRAGWTFDVAWAGYYVTTDDVIGTRSRYGGPASYVLIRQPGLFLVHADQLRSDRALAPWGLEYMPGHARLPGFGSLFPGHTMYDVNTFDYYRRGHLVD